MGILVGGKEKTIAISEGVTPQIICDALKNKFPECEFILKNDGSKIKMKSGKTKGACVKIRKKTIHIEQWQPSILVKGLIFAGPDLDCLTPNMRGVSFAGKLFDIVWAFLYIEFCRNKGEGIGGKNRLKNAEKILSKEFENKNT